MKKTVHDASTLSQEFHNIIKDVESLLKEASALGGDEYASVRAKLLARLAAAKAEMAKLGLNIAEKVHESTADVSEEIREEPWKAVGTAAVAGLLIGYLFARR
jgi:ElaB/YqjD/DUF883 family membrane-anchored ribosome-binding protein